MRNAIAVVFAIVCIASYANRARSEPPRDDSNVADISEGIELLKTVRDGSFSFDDDGFYWFCRYVRVTSSALTSIDCDPDDALPWRFLMERPSDYRGRAVCIEGQLLRADPPYDVTGRPGVGTLHQIELGTAGSGAVATLVLTDPPPTTTKRSLIRARAYFIKVRSFRTESGGEGAGPLLVARSFDVVTDAKRPATERTAPNANRVLSWMVGATAILFLLMLVVRRRVVATAGSAELPNDPQGMTGTEADFDWLDDGAKRNS